MVEFALIAAPLLIFVIAIMELGLSYWASTLLDTATQETARQIRTGEIQAEAGQEATAEELFKDNICDAMVAVISCDESDRFLFDVRSFESFEDVDLSPPETDEETGAVLTRFQPGTASEVILVRTYYRWELFTPLMNKLLSHATDQDGNIILASTVAFRSEPFPVVEEEAGGAGEDG